MKRIGWMVLVLGLAVSGVASSSSSNLKVFPFSTQLGGIHCGMPLKDAISKLGEKYKGFYSAVSGETPTWCVGYNNPSGKGSILIDSGAGDKKDAEGISGIFLSAEPVARAPKAKVSFLKKGTAAGIRLGDSLKQVKKLYPKLKGPEKEGKVLYYESAVPSPEEWPCVVSFWVKDDKVIKIFSGFMP